MNRSDIVSFAGRPGHDLRRACVHEYAHLAVAAHFGACGFVTIVRVAGNATDEVAYSGRFQMHGELTDEEWRIVALAGTIAELVDEEPTIDAASICNALDEGSLQLSNVDAKLARGYDPRDIERCLAIVRCAWTTIDADVTQRCAHERALRL